MKRVTTCCVVCLLLSCSGVWGEVSIVVLPPSDAAGASMEQVATAEAWCDQLAEKLGDIDGVSVVDRTALKKVLAERKLNENAQPAMSYDAMVRVDASGQCDLIDLSTGNRMDRAKGPQAPKRFAKTLQQRLADKTKRTHIRIVGLVDTPTRMTPLGQRLVELFTEALSTNSSIEAVQHLEAATAAEESLLLYMGLTKLPGARSFAPQADVTMEFRVAETNAIGKTFEKTKIEVGGRVQPAGAAQAKWVTVAGTVAEYDQLAKKVWIQLATQFPALSADASTQAFDALATRRKQAKLEFRAAQSLQPEDNMSKSKLLEARIRHLDVALKLDPQFRAASKLRIESMHWLLGANFEEWEGHRKSYPQIFQIEEHDIRFPAEPGRDDWMQSYAWLAVRMSPLMNLYMKRPVRISPKADGPAIRSLQRMIEQSVSGSPRGLTSGTPRFLPVVYRGIKQLGVSRAARTEWLNSTVASVQKQIIELPGIRAWDQPDLTFRAYWICLIAAELFIEDGQADRGKSILGYIRTQFDKPGGPKLDSSQYPDLYEILRSVTKQLNDPATLAQTDRWIASRTLASPLKFVNRSHSSPKVRLFSEKDITATYFSINVLPDHRALFPLRVIGVVGKYLYFRFPNDSSYLKQLFRVPLDAEGYPQRTPVATGDRRTGPATGIRWNSIEKVSLPTLTKQLVRTYAVTSTHLLLGTPDKGLWVFNSSDGSWRSFTPTEGLPRWNVDKIFPIGPTEIICETTGSTKLVHEKYRYLVNLASGKIKLLQKDIWHIGPKGNESHEGVHLRMPLGMVWKQDDVLWGYWAYTGLWRNFLAKKPKALKLPSLPAVGWSQHNDLGNGGQSISLGKRVYLSPAGEGGGLVGIDRKGKIIETIYTGSVASLPGYRWHWQLTDIRQPGAIPRPREYVGAGGRYLWMNQSDRSILYDTKTKLFYGPLRTHLLQGSAVGTKAGLFQGNSAGNVDFYSHADFIDVAKKEGRFGTIQKYERFRDDAIGKLPAVFQARYLLTLRRFNEAQTVLTAHLKKNPDDPLAVLLQGILLDVQDTTAVTPARKWYQKLVAMDDSKAKFTGLYMQLPMLVREKQWVQAAAVLKEIRQQFPLIEDDYAKEIDGLERKIKRANKK